MPPRTANATSGNDTTSEEQHLEMAQRKKFAYIQYADRAADRQGENLVAKFAKRQAVCESTCGGLASSRLASWRFVSRFFTLP
jgi:hypothetical protein